MKISKQQLCSTIILQSLIKKWSDLVLITVSFLERDYEVPAYMKYKTEPTDNRGKKDAFLFSKIHIKLDSPSFENKRYCRVHTMPDVKHYLASN